MDFQKTTLQSFLMSNYGVEIDEDYTAQIIADFTAYKGEAKWLKSTFYNGIKNITRTKYTLNMAKKVCEDWASLLLNEKTEITVDNEAEQVFLFGDEKSKGKLDANFWDLQNKLVERAFATGTAATLIRYTAIDESGNITKNSDVELHYIDARHIIPISSFNGEIKECAFVSQNGKELVVEAHTLQENGQYLIKNDFFKVESGDNLIRITKDDVPAEYLSDIKLFHIVKPNLYNPLIDNGLGLSIITYARDALISTDLAYDNFCCDIELGKKKMFLKKDLLSTKADGSVQTPQDADQQLFQYVGDGLPSENPLISEFNPSLRVAENAAAVQSMLDYLSFRVGFGTKHYQFNNGAGAVTATQYVGDKQEMVQNANKHYITLRSYLEGLIIALSNAYAYIGQGTPVNAIDVLFSDGFIIDDEFELEQMRADVIAQIIDKKYYIMKKYKKNEEEAEEMAFKMSEVETPLI